jgi:hypothetical protein
MQNLTSDTTPIRKAMDEYKRFIVHEYHNEEPVSEDLEEEARRAVEIAREEILLEVAEWIKDTFIFSENAKKDFSQTFNIKLL